MNFRGKYSAPRCGAQGGIINPRILTVFLGTGVFCAPTLFFLEAAILDAPLLQLLGALRHIFCGYTWNTEPIYQVFSFDFLSPVSATYHTIKRILLSSVEYFFQNCEFCSFSIRKVFPPALFKLFNGILSLFYLSADYC
ncbi:MAG: hypothetical protein G01um101417_588 [Parcubacteria group bacterium Gr01-1014_17]|nr:MAG: hypothetical protein G01um101417_588 [Parcubacteria group bacterium Gr01-1014_17]